MKQHVCSCGDCSPEPYSDTCQFETQALLLVDKLENFAKWIERDRREPDKVLLYAQSMRAAAARFTIPSYPEG
jgi:hypothetical protein